MNKSKRFHIKQQQQHSNVPPHVAHVCGVRGCLSTVSTFILSELFPIHTRLWCQNHVGGPYQPPTAAGFVPFSWKAPMVTLAWGRHEHEGMIIWWVFYFPGNPVAKSFIFAWAPIWFRCWMIWHGEEHRFSERLLKRMRSSTSIRNQFLELAKFKPVRSFKTSVRLGNTICFVTIVWIIL